MKPNPTAHPARRRAFALVGAAALAAGLAVALPTAATADPLSPQTGAGADPTDAPTPLGSGVVHYVDASTGDDTADGLTPETAWQTLAAVDAGTFAPGDVVAFHRGQTFQGSATVESAGTAEAPITLTGYGDGARPVLTNPGGWNMLVLDAAYLDVEGLAFEDGVEFDNADGQGIRGPKYELSGAVAITSNGTAAEVRDSVFTDVGLGVKTYGENSVIEQNTFQSLRIAFRGFDSGSETSYGAIGISIDNSGVRVSRNDFLDCRSTDSPYGADGGAIEIEGFAHDKDHITIDHNYSRGSQGFVEVTETNSSNVVLSYNVSDDYQQFVAWDTTTHPDGYLAVNNTVVRSNDTSRLFDQYYYREAGPEPTADWITIRNNVFVADAWLTFHDFPRDHNLYSPGVGLDVPLGEGDVVGDPALADVDAHEITPTAVSPAIDAGTPSTEAVDLLGNPTSVGGGTDLGAIEVQDAVELGPVLTADPSFETQAELSDTSTPWFSEGSIYTGFDVAAGKAHTGDDNAWLAGRGTFSGAIVQTVPVTPDTRYRLTTVARDADGVDSLRLGARSADGSPLTEIRFGHTADYVPYAVTFDSGSATSVDVYVAMDSPNGGLWAQIDDVVLQEVGSAADPGAASGSDPGAGGAGAGAVGSGAAGFGSGAGTVSSVTAGASTATGLASTGFLGWGALAAAVALLSSGALLYLRRLRSA